MHTTTSTNTVAKEITLQELITEHRAIAQLIRQYWPLKDHNQRVLARTLKMMEELGELSDEILSSMNLQRQSKVAQFDPKDLADEFADVLACVLLLGIELDIDIEAVIKEKISFTHERLAAEYAQAHKRQPTLSDDFTESP